jgi:hypothetical protein
MMMLQTQTHVSSPVSTHHIPEAGIRSQLGSFVNEFHLLSTFPSLILHILKVSASIVGMEIRVC